jgi:hypothetical protein
MGRRSRTVASLVAPPDKKGLNADARSFTLNTQMVR